MIIQKSKSKRGFTLIEILIAISIASTVMGMLIYMLMSSMDLRKKSIRLNTAVFLAMNLMDEIKNNPDATDSSGEFQNNPGFTYSYTVKEIEYDPFSGLTSNSGSKEQETLEQHRAAQSTSLSTGLLFKMIQFNVILYYQEKLIYELESLRGLTVEQTAQ